MQFSKNLDIFVSDSEVVKEATSIELMRIIRDGLKKIHKEYLSMHNQHCRYLKEFRGGKHHATKELIKFQEDCIMTALKACVELKKTMGLFEKALKELEAYHKVRGFKGEFP